MAAARQTDDTRASIPGPDFIPIARVDRSHGLRGEVLVTVHADDPGRLRELGSVYMLGPGGDPREVPVERAKRVGGRCALKLAGINTIQEARALMGQDLFIPRSASTPAPPGRYYAYQLSGLSARLKDGSIVGTIREVLKQGSKSFLVVESTGGDILVPFVRAICVSIDVEGGTMTLDPPQGLLELNEKARAG